MKNTKAVLVVMFIFGLSLSLFPQSHRVIQKGNEYYLSNRIVVKIRANLLNKSSLINGYLSGKLSSLKIAGINNFTGQNINQYGLNRIFILDYLNEDDPKIVAAKIGKLSEIEYAEPYFLYPLDYSPNDPFFFAQYHLPQIKAQQAWDISKGDTSVVIGIVDTGVDWNHPDLLGNLWINKNEIENNGIDDDLNGFVDDYRGWDFGGLNGTSDNNPTEDRPDHGTGVAGVASAVTDNNIGIASIGFNCKIMAVKTAQDNLRDQFGRALIAYGYQGILYAASNGAKVVNCSWGSLGGYSRTGQDIINFAISKGVLVVGAAGNDNSSEEHYPSGYNGVLSVTSVNQNDVRSSFSNFGYSVDACAPGENIYSTWMNDTYQSLSGTSFSAPLTAGLAALIVSKFPDYSPAQIVEQIRVTCDNIDNVNQGYEGLLGGGRINAYKALTVTDAKSLRAYSYEFTDKTEGGDGDDVFEPGEVIQLNVKLRNILSQMNNLTVNLQSISTFYNVLTSAYSIGSLNTNDSVYLQFRISLQNNVPDNYALPLMLVYNDGSYSDRQYMQVIVNPTYLNQDANEIDMTITSTGNLGFNDYPNNQQGIGLKYKNQANMLFEGALMYGVSNKLVNDAARSQDANQQSKDFTSVLPFVLKTPGAVADQQGFSVFNDNAAGQIKLGIETKLSTYSFADIPYDKFVILRYKMTNKSAANITGFYAGIYFDWDLVDGTNDFASYDSTENFGYVYHVGGSPDSYLGCALISSDNFGYYAVLNPGGDGGFGVYDGFTDTEKWQALSGGLAKMSSGPGDVSMVVSSGPYNINIGDSIEIAFAIVAGDNREDIRNSVALSKVKYSQIITAVDEEVTKSKFDFRLWQNFPNPFNPVTTINYTIKEKGLVQLKVYDVLGNEVKTLVDEERPKGSHSVIFDGSNLPSGVYFYKIETGKQTVARKMVLLK